MVAPEGACANAPVLTIKRRREASTDGAKRRLAARMLLRMDPRSRKQVVFARGLHENGILLYDYIEGIAVAVQLCRKDGTTVADQY